MIPTDDTYWLHSHEDRRNFRVIYEKEPVKMGQSVQSWNLRKDSWSYSQYFPTKIGRSSFVLSVRCFSNHGQMKMSCWGNSRAPAMNLLHSMILEPTEGLVTLSWHGNCKQPKRWTSPPTYNDTVWLDGVSVGHSASCWVWFLLESLEKGLGMGCVNRGARYLGTIQKFSKSMTDWRNRRSFWTVNA